MFRMCCTIVSITRRTTNKSSIHVNELTNASKSTRTSWRTVRGKDVVDSVMVRFGLVSYFDFDFAGWFAC